jgi:hypothetical protein
MTDTEERIARLQKLLDRVLSRGDETPLPDGAEEPLSEPADTEDETRKAKRDREDDVDAGEGDKGEASEASASGADQEASASGADQETPSPEKPEAAPPDEAGTVVQGPPEPAAPETTALESRSRLVAADPVEELSEEDLIPESKTPPPSDLESAVPLVRRSRAPAEPQPQARRTRTPEEELSDGRIVLSLEDVQISDDSLMSDEEHLAAVIAAEEAQSGELEQDAPTSSRRPIALETRVTEDEPHHTPPPESGKQVAAPPTSDDEVTAVRKSSAPPPETVDVIRPELAQGGVATFTGVASAPRPASFGELLDEALRL